MYMSFGILFSCQFILTSLLSNRFTEEEFFSSMSLRESLGGIQEAAFPTSSTPHMQPGAPSNFTKDAQKNSYGLIFCPGAESKGTIDSHSVTCKGLCCCSGYKANDKECFGGSMFNLQEASHPQFVSRCDESAFDNDESPTISFNDDSSGFERNSRVEDMPQIENRDVNIARCSKKCGFSSSLITTTTVPSPSFEFYVSSDQGINLCVDLNSSPSDWIKKLKEEVYMSENVCHNKCQSIHQELGHFGERNKQINSSFKMNLDAGQTKDDHLQTGCSSSSLMKEPSYIGFDLPNECNGSLASNAMKLSGVVVHMVEPLRDKGIVPSKTNSDAQDQMVSGTESGKDGCLINLDSDAIDTPWVKSGGDSVASTSDGSTSVVTLEHQILKLDNEICENSTLLNSGNLLNPAHLIGGSVEMLSTEVEIDPKGTKLSPCKNDNLVDLVDPMHNIGTETVKAAYLRELNHGTCMNHLPTCVEEQEMKKITNGREHSECLENDGSYEKTCIRLENRESNEGLCKKRPCVDSDDNLDSGKPDAKIFGTVRHFAGKVLPRRSMRLVSKVPF
ncbi:hypothetical protein CFOL_v3_13371 [Cephalotus follicularis]|uniref:Uncharacterized protein n=1 Tax=Cephalotus follicularis TaxID=3775 RepID=A0A1Q3BPD0_CEPFO|nr:hypothetical protein CFOL_v3_13371 [Cephalotus follicularis]